MKIEDQPHESRSVVLLRNGNRQGNPANAPRCLARNRRGSPCQSPAMRGKKRCRLHGGHGSGAPPGNQNAFKHGLFSKEMLQRKKQVSSLLKQARVSMMETD